MTRIFISYRRSDDPGSVGRVRDRLQQAYGEDAIFRDIEGIPKGTRFAEVIDKELERCTDLLVVIGPHWLEAADSEGARRLDNPDDWVRNEIEAGLARHDLQVVPVLVGGAALPRADQLPESIRPLLEGLTIAPPTGPVDDESALVAGLEAALAETRLAVESTDRHEPEYRWQEAFYLVQLGRDDEARAALAAATVINPDFGIVTVENMEAQAQGRIVPSAHNAPAIASRIPQLALTD